MGQDGSQHLQQHLNRAVHSGRLADRPDPGPLAEQIPDLSETDRPAAGPLVELAIDAVEVPVAHHRSVSRRAYPPHGSLRVARTRPVGKLIVVPV